MYGTNELPTNGYNIPAVPSVVSKESTVQRYILQLNYRIYHRQNQNQLRREVVNRIKCYIRCKYKEILIY